MQCSQLVLFCKLLKCSLFSRREKTLCYLLQIPVLPDSFNINPDRYLTDGEQCHVV